MPLTSAKALTVASHAVFVPVGIVTVLLGPMLPALSLRWSLNYAQAGSLFTIQFAASTLGVAFSGVLVQRLGFRSAIVAGLIPMSVGVSALAANSHFFGILGITAYGIGLGLSIPACNLLVAEVNPERRSAALNLLNFSWSVGAVACPFLIGAAAARNEVPALLYTIAVAMLLIAAVVARMGGERKRFAASVPPALPRTVPTINWGDPVLVVFCGLFFLYVGVENAVGGWAASYAKHIAGPASTFAVMTSSFFYIALMVGRWLAPQLLRSLPEVKLARSGLVLACLGMLGLLASRTMTGVVSSVAVAGLGLSAVYPITISLLSETFGSAASRAGSVMFTMANLGGASLPWLVGFSSTRFGNLKAGLTVPLIAGVLTVILYFRKWKVPGSS